MATVIDVDVTGVESTTGGGTVDPKPGVMPCKIAFAEKRDKKNSGEPANDIRVALDFGGDYVWKFTYIGLGPESDWKLAEFVRALGLKDKVKLDLEKIKGTMLRAKLNPDTYENEPTTKVGRLMKGQSGDVLPEATEGGESDDEPSNDEPTAATNGAYPDGYEPEREGDDLGSYDDWPTEDVEAEVADRGLTVAGGRGKKIDKLIAALRVDDENPLDGDAATPEATADGEDDYESWSVEEMEKEVTDRSLDMPKKPRGSGANERYATALVEALREDDEANPFDPNAK